MERFARLVLSDGGTEDPHAVYRELRERLPIFFCEVSDAWVVSRHADVREALRNGDAFEVPQEGAGSSIHGRMVLRLTGGEHQAGVAPIARHLRRRDALDGKVAESIDRHVQSASTAVCASEPPLDLSELFTLFPARVICDIMGLEEPPEELRRWAHATAAAGVGNPTGIDERRRAGIEARDQIRGAAQRILEASGACSDTLVAALAESRFEGRSMPRDEVLANSSFLFTAGVETTARALASLFKHALAVDRGLLDQLRGDGDDQPSPLAVVAEALRMYPPVHGVFRHVVAATTLADQALSPGDRVLVLLASANRDMRVFPDPDRFLPERFARPEREFTGGAQIMTFGAGMHYCTGSLLAQREMLALSEALAPSLEEAVIADEQGAEDAGLLLRSPQQLVVCPR